MIVPSPPAIAVPPMTPEATPRYMMLLPPANGSAEPTRNASSNPARPPKVLVRRGGANRIEISLSREVLVLYRNNRVQLISQVSTGGHYYYCSPGGG